jgi:GNAT superfamily N-acetyltransferase
VRSDDISISIRSATASDETAFLDLLEELFEPPGARPPSYTRELGRRGFRHAIENPGSDVLLAVEDGRVIGLASLYADIVSIRYGPRCWLQDLVVTKPRRSGTVGKQLLDAATAWAKERGCTHLELSSGDARVDAHRFYMREGMVRSSCFQRWIG